MTNTPTASRTTYLLLWLIIGLSLPIKLAAAQNMPFDIDIIPVLSRSVEYTLPPVGTLSSVAAYNMPMLQWLHLPALTLAHNAFATILLTMLTFNILSTIAVFWLGYSMFNERMGLAAATLFTFSEVGISSAYTAWAQLLLPGFYAMTFLFLWQWRKYEQGKYLALAGIIATAAFMTHFSAILLYAAMLVFALLTRAKWQWRWLLAGVFVCLLMLAPYLVYEAQHDFVDIRAFLKQETRVSPEVLAAVQYLKPESGLLPREQLITQQTPVAPVTANQQPSESSATVKPRWQRGIDFLLSVPSQYLRGIGYGFSTTMRGLPSVWRWALYIPPMLFVLSVGWALWASVKPHPLTPSPSSRRGNHGTFTEYWRKGADILVETPHGKIVLLLLFVLTIMSCLILTRNINEPTYFMGLTSLQLVLAAAIFTHDKLPRWLLILGAMLIITYAAVSTAERAARLYQHNDSAYSRFNVSIYRHVANAVDYIAADWQGGDTVTVSYDIMPEMRDLWWVVAWHSIDPQYRMGMNFDFLLSYQHGLTNTNIDAIGYVETADYFVVYEPGLARFNLDEYTVAQFGTIYVLRENP